MEGGGKPLIKEGGKLFVKAWEPIGQGKDDGVVKGGRKLFVESGWMVTDRRESEREDASTREDASAREGGCWPFIERGRSPFVERGRRLLFIVVGGKNNEFLPCWEIQSSTMLEFQIQWT